MHLISRYGWMLIPLPSFTSSSPIYTLFPKCSALVMKAEHQDSTLPSSITGSPLASSTKVLPHHSPAQQWSHKLIGDHIRDTAITWVTFQRRKMQEKVVQWNNVSEYFREEKSMRKVNGASEESWEAQATEGLWDGGDLEARDRHGSILLWRVVSPGRMKSSDYHSVGAEGGEGPTGGKGTWGQDRLRKVWEVSWVQALIPSLLTQHETLGLSLPLWPSGGPKSISPLLLPSAPGTVHLLSPTSSCGEDKTLPQLVRPFPWLTS